MRYPVIAFYCAFAAPTFAAPAFDLANEPIEILEPVVRHLSLKDRTNVLQVNKRIRDYFKENRAFTLVQKYGANAYEVSVNSDYVSSKAVINAMPPNFISQIINLYAGKREWEKVQFIIESGGVNPSVLKYSMRRAKVHEWLEDIDKLMGLGVPDFDVVEIDINLLNSRFSDPNIQHHASKIGIDFPLQEQTAKSETLDKLLYVAAKERLVDTVNLLIEYGANVNAAVNGQTPLHCASSDEKVIDSVVSLMWAFPTAKKFILPLAQRDGDELVVKSLLEAGADISAKNGKGITPLFLAAEVGLHAIVTLLIEAGAGLKNGNSQSTPLHVAALTGSYKVAKVLLAAGVPVDAKDADGCTPLHHAVTTKFAGADKVAELLLAAGADKYAKNNNGETPLGLAFRFRKISIIKSFIRDIIIYNINLFE